MEDRKIVYKETAVVAIGQAVCLGLMLLCYYLLDSLSSTVLLSGILGTFLAVGNFFFMAVGTSLAADKAEAQDVAGGQKLLQLSMLVRYLVMAAVLLVAAKSNKLDLLSLGLPLLFTRPVLTFGEFFRKKGDK